jgi:Tfp pilus assembly protein PilF
MGAPRLFCLIRPRSHMKKCAFGVFLISCLVFGRLQAQSRGTDCDGTPPAHWLDRNGNVLPEYREWDPGQCAAAASPHPSSPAAISVKSLAHKPSKEARKEYARGMQDSRRGHSDEAVQHLLEAIRLDPDFLDAQNELGVLYVRMGRADLALAYLDRALALEPNVAVLHTNKASALVTLNRPAEAEPEARRAIQLDPSSPEANYMLGVTLMMQQKTSEAAAYLAVAAPKYPRARAFFESLQKQLGRSQTQ